MSEMDALRQMVRDWVCDHAYDENDFVVPQGDIQQLLDLIDPAWRSVFEVTQ